MGKVGNPNIAEAGRKTRWKKGEVPNPNGRPRKLISDVIKKLDNEGVKETSAEEIKSMYLRLMNFEVDELEKVSKDKKSPALIRIVSKSILSGKGFDVLETMIDRAVGRALEKIDHTSKGEKINVINLGDGLKPKND